MSSHRMAIAFGLIISSFLIVGMSSSAQAAAADTGQLAFSKDWFEAFQGSPFTGVTVVRTGGASGAATVVCMTHNASAIAGVNYTAESITLHWADGDATPRTCPVGINNSDHFSGHLMLSVGLSAPTGATLGLISNTQIIILGNQGSGTLALQASTYSVAQGAGSITLSIDRTGGSVGYVAVAYRTLNTTAIAGSDYTNTYGEMHWEAGDASPKTITIPISKAKPFSGTKTLEFQILSPFVAPLGSPASAVVTITGSSTPAPAAGNVAFVAPTYAVPQSKGAAVISVARSGGTSGAAAVSYATSNGTAAAGQNFTAQSGTLSWADGDGTARNIVVPVATAAPISSAVNFKVALAKVSGAAAVGAPSATTVTITPNPPPSTVSISVSGNKLIDAQGSEVQLRGVNVSGLEAVAVLGWSPANPWGSQTGTPTPDWTTLKSWGSNVVRLPLNEASWLGLSCIDEGGFGSTVTNGVQTQNKPGTVVKADPGGNYQATVASTVASATAAGLYVILDLHLAAPGNICPNVQNPMADADHSVTFWTSVATAFKGSPNVIFELFNEPFLDMTAALVGNTPWPDLLNGGATLTYVAAAAPGNSITVPYTWKTAGMQQLLNAVRATGATNVVLVSTNSYASAIFNWLEYKPTDPLNQLAAVWHAYPTPAYPTQVNCVNMPGCSAVVMAASQAIKAAGYPVVITEYGDVIGGSTSPWSAVLLPFADANDISYLGWTWDVWPGMSEYVLITDAAGDPTQGYGTYVKAHYLCRAAGTAVCP